MAVEEPENDNFSCQEVLARSYPSFRSGEYEPYWSGQLEMSCFLSRKGIDPCVFGPFEIAATCAATP